jgi:hypothetical protein
VATRTGAPSAGSKRKSLEGRLGQQILPMEVR